MSKLHNKSSQRQPDLRAGAPLEEQALPQEPQAPTEETATAPAAPRGGLGSLLMNMRSGLGSLRAPAPAAPQAPKPVAVEPEPRPPQVIVEDFVAELATKKIEPISRVEGAIALRALQEMGISFQARGRVEPHLLPKIDRDAVRVLAVCPEGGLTAAGIAEALMLDPTTVDSHLAELQEKGLVNITGANAKNPSASITPFGAKVADHMATKGDSIEETLGLLDLQLAGANHGYAEANSATPKDLLQVYTRALMRPSSPKTRVDAVQIAVANLQELAWMARGLGEDRTPEGFDKLANYLYLTFPEPYLPSVAPSLRKMVEIQRLFEAGAEMERRSGHDLVGYVTSSATYRNLHAEGPSLSTLKTASLMALNALKTDASAYGQREPGLGATPNNAARIARAVLESAGKGARICSFEQFQTLLDPAVGALAATSAEGMEALGERVRFTRREAKLFIADLARPVLNQYMGNAEAALQTLKQVAEHTGFPLTETESNALRADLQDTKRVDAALAEFASALSESVRQHPEHLIDIARTISVEASAAGVDGALRLYTFLAHAHPGDLIEDLSMAILAARGLATHPNTTDSERSEATAFAKSAEMFLLTVGGVSPTSNQQLVAEFEDSIQANLQDRGPKVEVEYLRSLMAPQGQPGIWASTPENRSYKALSIAQAVEMSGLQAPEIQHVLALRGLQGWETTIRSTKTFEEPQPETLADRARTSPAVASRNIEAFGVRAFATPANGWTKQAAAEQIANSEDLIQVDGAVWLVGGANTLLIPVMGGKEEIETAILNSVREHDTQILVTSHGGNPEGIENLAHLLSAAGKRVRLMELGERIAEIASTREPEVSESEIEDAGDTVADEPQEP